MKDILQKWLAETMGLLVDFVEINKEMKDGTLLLKILKHYDAINPDTVVYICPTRVDEICYYNLNQLKMTFKLLDVDFSDEIISGIVGCNTSVCIRILSQLFLTLENTNSIGFITKQKERFIKNSDNKFKVQKIPKLSTPKINLEEMGYFNYSDRILQNRKIINWYENKYGKKKKSSVKKDVGSTLPPIFPEKARPPVQSDGSVKCIGHRKTKSKCFEEDVMFVRNLPNVFKHQNKIQTPFDINATIEDNDENYATQSRYGKLDDLDRKGCIVKCNTVLPPISKKIDFFSSLPQHVQCYFNELKNNLGFFKKKRRSKSHFNCPSILNTVWNVFIEEEEADLKKVITSKLCKQSRFEKQLTMKLFQIMNQNAIQKQIHAELEERLNSGDKHSKEETVENYERCSQISDKRYVYEDYVHYYRAEKRRTVELHRKLYAEKLKLRFEKHYALCLHTLEDIIDLAIKKSEFENMFCVSLPETIWSEWKCLFHNGQPIFDVIENMDELLCPNLRSNAEFFTELTRQNILNEYNLNNYLNVLSEWGLQFKNYDDYDDDEDGDESDLSAPVLIDSSSFVIGYIVHRLLERKYPLPPRPRPADIPKYPIRGVINDLDDEMIMMKLKILLMKSEILLVNVNSAVNFCIQFYKNETNAEEMNAMAQGSIYSTKKQGVDKQSSQLSQCMTASLMNIEVNSEDSQFKTEFTQVSSSIMDLEYMEPLSETARVGGELLKAMFLGSELPTNVIVNAIVCFIKHNQNKIKGWVVVNFPSTLSQASVFEYILSGKKFPYHLDDETTGYESDTCVSTLRDNHSSFETETKCSKLVPNLRKYSLDDTFKTSFSFFLMVVKGETMVSASLDTIEQMSDYSQSESTLLLEHPEKEGVPTICAFYQHEGISYDFIYETFDLNTIKELARLILSHNANNTTDDTSRQPSVELFGEDILNGLAQDLQHTGYGAAAVPKNGIGQVKVVKNRGIASSTHVDEHHNQSLINKHGSVYTSSLSKSELNGVVCNELEEHPWVYADQPIADNVAISMASFWEWAETGYINDLKEVFFLKRNYDYSMIPYINYITKQMEICFNKQDDRQIIVTEFLEKYNGIHPVLRSDIEMKNELHRRVNEFKNELVGRCEIKRDAAKALRLNIIRQNWTYQHMASVVNAYISLLQIEADRCVNTLELIHNYYCAMLELYINEPIPVITLSKITVETVSSFNEESEEEYKDIGQETTPETLSLAEEIVQRILEYSDGPSKINPFYVQIESKAEKIFAVTEQLKSNFTKIVGKEEATAMKRHNDFVAKRKKEKIEEEKRLKKQGKSAGKSNETPKSDEQPIGTEVVENFEEMEKTLRNLFVEWNTAIKEELERLLYRIDLIKGRAASNLIDIETTMGSTFADFHVDLMDKFRRECGCIDDICKIFQVAIEEHTPLHAELNFDQDHFYAAKIVLEKAEVVVKLPTALEEMLYEESFTIKQLEAIKDRLMVIAPDGVISQQSFVQFLGTIVHDGSTEQSFNMVPNIWKRLQPEEIENLFYETFGNLGLIEWRDFLIYCLNLPYPLTEDIVDAKLQFLKYDSQESEIISYDNYMNSTLWFHRELPESPLHTLRNILAKEFLFSLYKVNDVAINYVALLFAFCKDVDIKVGFGKALSLVMEQCVIVYEEDLFLEQILTDHIQTEQKVVKHILDSMISEVVNTSSDRMDLTINEMENFEKNFGDDSSETSSADSSDIMAGPVLTETMYDQFFRRHKALRWTSSVPLAALLTVCMVSLYPLFSPSYVYEMVFRLYDRLQVLMLDVHLSNKDTIVVPLFVKMFWVDQFFQAMHTFKAVSMKSVIHEIIEKRDKKPSQSKH